MKKNVANWDRVLRLFLGIPLTAWAVAGGPLWAYLGLGLIATSAWAYSPLYALLRMSTKAST